MGIDEHGLICHKQMRLCLLKILYFLFIRNFVQCSNT